MPKKQTSAEKFFLEHGGYSRDPNKETVAQAKRRSASQAAKAEELAESMGWTFTWDHDPDPYEMGDNETEPPAEVLFVVMKNENNEVVGSLSGIGMSKNLNEARRYGRVVESELALEYAHERGLL